MRTTTVYASVADRPPVVTVLPNGEIEYACGPIHLYAYDRFVPETRLERRMLRLYHLRARRYLRWRRRWTDA